MLDTASYMDKTSHCIRSLYSKTDLRYRLIEQTLGENGFANWPLCVDSAVAFNLNDKFVSQSRMPATSMTRSSV